MYIHGYVSCIYTYIWSSKIYAHMYNPILMSFYIDSIHITGMKSLPPLPASFAGPSRGYHWVGKAACIACRNGWVVGSSEQGQCSCGICFDTWSSMILFGVCYCAVLMMMMMMMMVMMMMLMMMMLMLMVMVMVTLKFVLCSVMIEKQPVTHDDTHTHCVQTIKLYEHLHHSASTKMPIVCI